VVPASGQARLHDANREKQPFRLDVCKLKELWLTESLEVGFRLSSRGWAVIDRNSAG